MLILIDNEDFLSRADFLQLLHVSPSEAYILLKKLVKQGHLSCQMPESYVIYIIHGWHEAFGCVHMVLVGSFALCGAFRQRDSIQINVRMGSMNISARNRVQ